MPRNTTDNSHPDYFNRLVQFGEFVDPAVVESAGRLLLASDTYHVAKLSELQSPNASEPVDSIQRYVDAARYGDYILSGKVELDKKAQELVSKDDIANVLGHLRLFDKMQSGALVGRFVGLKLPEEDDVSISQKAKYDLAFERNNAIIQAGRIWNGVGLEKFDSKPIHEARAKIGEAAYAEFGPDLGPNLTALAYSSVLHTVALTEDLRHRIPEQISNEVAGRYRTSTLHKTQVNAGRVAIIDKLANIEPAFPINTDRLAVTMDNWASEVMQQADKLEFIQKLFHVSGRDVPEWVDVAKSAVSGAGLEPDLATAYKLHNALANVLAFDAEKSGFKMFKTILDNARIINLVDRAYTELNRQPTPTVFIAKAVIEGQQVEPIIEETKIHQPTAIGQTVAMIKKIVEEIPSGTSPETALKIIKRTIQDRPITRPKNKPKSSDAITKPVRSLVPAQAPKPINTPEPRIMDSTEVEAPQTLPVRSFSMQDVSDLPLELQDILIQYSVKTRTPIETILNDAVQLYIAGHSVRAILKKPLEALLAQVKDSSDSE